MNAATRTQIDNILTSYLAALEDSMGDLNDAYQRSPTDYFNALQRHKVLAESCLHTTDALSCMVTLGEHIKEAKK